MLNFPWYRGHCHMGKSDFFPFLIIYRLCMYQPPVCLCVFQWGQFLDIPDVYHSCSPRLIRSRSVKNLKIHNEQHAIWRQCAYEHYILWAAARKKDHKGIKYLAERLKSSFRNFYGRYGGLIQQYEVSLSRMLNDILILDQQWLSNQSDFPQISWHGYRAGPLWDMCHRRIKFRHKPLVWQYGHSSY